MKIDRNFFWKGLTRNIIVVGIISLFTDLSSQMVFPLIPLYLITLGASAWIIGLVEGAAETTASLLKVLSGYFSDKNKKRKPFILVGYGLSSITKPLFAFVYSWPFVLIIRIIERVGKGIRNAPRDAIIAESCNSGVRGKAYGLHRALDGIGSIFGSVIAFILLPILGFRDIFLIAFIPAIIGVFFIFLIKEKKQLNVNIKEKNISLKLSLKQMPWNLRLFIIVVTIFTFGHFGYAFLLLKARNIGLDNDIAIFLYVLFYIVYTLLIIPAGIFSDKIGRKPVLMIGYIIFGLTSFGLLFTSEFYLLLMMFILYGIFYALIDGVQRAFVVDLAPHKFKGTALGTFHTVVGLVALPGGIIAGSIWDIISPQVTFVYALILTILSIILFIFVKKQ
jgi:MFS family permease